MALLHCKANDGGALRSPDAVAFGPQAKLAESLWVECASRPYSLTATQLTARTRNDYCSLLQNHIIQVLPVTEVLYA